MRKIQMTGTLSIVFSAATSVMSIFISCSSDIKQDMLMPTELLVFQDEEAGVPIGVTGITAYKDGYLSFAKYHYGMDSKIVIKKIANNTIYKTIDISNHIAHIQGIAYNPANNSFFCWGMPSNGIFVYPWIETSSGFSDFIIIEVSFHGELIRTLRTPIADAYPGMLDYDQETNFLYLKANTSSIINIYSAEDMRHIKSIDTHIYGEGIAYDRRTNTFWLHDGLYVYNIDYSGKLITKYNSPTINKQSEGIVCLDNGDVWITADEYIHGGIINGNKAWKIN
jgi:hypothetical protein